MTDFLRKISAIFWKDVIAFQVVQPFRVDSLSYLAWFYQLRGVQISAIFAFIAALLVLVLVLWRAPRTPAGFAAGIALVFIVFFALNKQAFCNYYYFVIGTMCCAVAASRSGSKG